MRLFLLIALTMAAFAGNSVLNRLALAAGEAGPSSFAALRLFSGAAMLALLLTLREGARPAWRPNLWGAATLALYVVGFSLAYRTLEAGVGALILFGGVQVTMFAGAVLSSEAVPGRRWAGAVLAFGGLAWLLWPQGATAPDPAGAALMLAAALGWGLFSLRGRRGKDPLADTTWAFILACPAGVALALVLPDGMTTTGAALAIVSGALTSGLGYALWYRVLPQIAASTAALAQLSVPLLAMAGGAALLDEALTARFALATALVVAGVALGLSRPRRPD